LGPALTINFPVGANANGVEVASLVLTNESIFSDPTANSASVRNWGFQITGADSQSDRTTDLRNGFSFFSGHPPSTEPSNISDRRRLVVLQGVPGAQDNTGAPITQWQILYSSSEPDSTAMVNAINSVFPAAVAQTYMDWKTAQSIPAGMDGPFQDADGDGDENIKEFYFSTTPIDATSNSIPAFAPAVSSGYTFTFRQAKDITGVEMKLKCSSDLIDWSTEVLLTTGNTSTTDMTTHNEVTITLPAAAGEKFYRIELTESTP